MRPPLYTRNSREAMRRKRRVTLLICAMAAWAGMVGLYLLVR